MSGQCQSQREKEAKPYILPGSVLNITKIFLAAIVNANVNLKKREGGSKACFPMQQSALQLYACNGSDFAFVLCAGLI